MDDKKFKAPKFVLEKRKVVEIPFYGTIAAGAFLTLLSNKISYPFRITRLKMIFDERANNLVTHAWYINAGRGVSTTGPPSGTRLLSPESSTGTFSGRGIIRVVDTNIEVTDEGIFIKLYTFNGTGAAYVINGACTIEEI